MAREAPLSWPVPSLPLNKSQIKLILGASPIRNQTQIKLLTEPTPANCFGVKPSFLRSGPESLWVREQEERSRRRGKNWRREDEEQKEGVQMLEDIEEKIENFCPRKIY